MSRSFNAFNKRSPAIICPLGAFVIVYVVYGLLLVPNNSHLSAHNVSRTRLIASAPRPSNVATLAVKYTKEELERVMISQEARRAVEPRELMNRLKEIGLESKESKNKENSVIEKDDSMDAKQDVAADLAESLEVREARGPIAQLERLGQRGADWPETNDELEGGKLVLKGPEIEDGIIPGKTLPAECNAEPHTDFDGVAVRWGLTNPQESAADCCQACLDQARDAKEGELKCNVWVYCPAEEGCFSPDVYEHKHLECWLKQSEMPSINFKGRYPPDYRKAHPTCPQVVAWASGVTSPAS